MGALIIFAPPKSAITPDGVLPTQEPQKPLICDVRGRKKSPLLIPQIAIIHLSHPKIIEILMLQSAAQSLHICQQ